MEHDGAGHSPFPFCFISENPRARSVSALSRDSLESSLVGVRARAGLPTHPQEKCAGFTCCLTAHSLFLRMARLYRRRPGALFAASVVALTPSVRSLVSSPVLAPYPATRPQPCLCVVSGPLARIACRREMHMRGGGEDQRPTAAAPLKQLHLATDAGFIRATLLSLLLEGCLLGGAYSCGPLHTWAAGLSMEVKMKALGMAQQMASWTLLGLLSSSCCVIQIVLSAFSFGCAGFNTLLGPIRPPMIAFTLLMQIVAWYLVLPHPCHWLPTAAATVLSLVITFSPELLNLYYMRQLAAHKATEGSLGASDAAEALRSLPRSVVRIAFEPKAMGCISCVTKVRNALVLHPAVVDCTVSLPHASAVALLSVAHDGREDAEAANIARHLVDQVSWPVVDLAPRTVRVRMRWAVRWPDDRALYSSNTTPSDAPAWRFRLLKCSQRGGRLRGQVLPRLSLLLRQQVLQTLIKSWAREEEEESNSINLKR